MGIGVPLVTALGNGCRRVAGGIRAQAAQGVAIPSTPAAIWCLAARRRSRRYPAHGARRRGCSGWCVCSAVISRRVSLPRRPGSDGLRRRYRKSLREMQALQTAFVGAGELAGSSFVAVQQWRHDLDRFAAMQPQEQDHTIGRRRSDNEELDDAPESAHVKRTAQESFSPEAFLLRRSMPWTDTRDQGLVFVAFASSFAPFEAQLRRMIGSEDGIVDALFKFTRPFSNAYYWCPPVAGRTLDCSALGL